MKKLEELTFDNTYARLGEAYFSRVLPTPAPNPQLIAFNPEAAALLDLDPREAERPEFLLTFAGHRLLPGFDPLAMVYSGHQFGVRVPRLGDGRAMLLGEVLGKEGKRWDLHLKGCGLTPYSRQGDGRAVLRSSIREYLCGEAMHGLGIPTTRSLCIIGSSEAVYREEAEPRAQIVRMAPSHLRFGSFEYFYFRHHHEPETQKERLKRLADYAISEHFPEIQAAFASGPDGAEDSVRYAAWLKEVCIRTARLIAQWQAVGWAHGVLNTDNLSILGITLDYGPFGFIDDFDWGFIPNHSDSEGRYAFKEQPRIGLWNLNVLAGVLLPLMSEDQARDALSAYEPEFHQTLGRLLRAKLGLFEERSPEEESQLVSALYSAMALGQADHTLTFRKLSQVTLGSAAEVPVNLFEDFAPGASHEALTKWLGAYRARLRVEGQSAGSDRLRAERMNQVNPKYVLRNYLAQQAIDEAHQGRFAEIERLRKVLMTPFSEQPENEVLASRPPKWGRHLVVSCSS